MLKEQNKIYAKGLIALLLSATLGWSSVALTGIAEGSGSNRSAVPLGDKVLKVSFGTMHTWGSFLNTQRLALDEGGTTGTWISRDGFSRTDLGFGIAFGFTSFLETGLYLPYYSDADDRGDSYSGMGDMNLSFKFNYPPYKHSPLFELSYLLSFSLPTANDQTDGGFARNGYVLPSRNEVSPGVYTQDNDWTPYGSNSITSTMLLLMTLNMKASQNRVPVLLHGNFGLTVASPGYENIFHLGGGAEFWFGQYVALTWATEGQMDVSAATKHIRLAAYPMAHRVGLIGYIPAAGVSIDAGVQLVTNLKTGRDKQWGECSVSGDPRCSGAAGDVQDNGDTDFIHNQLIPAEQFKYSRLPSVGIYAGLSLAIKVTDDEGDETDWADEE